MANWEAGAKGAATGAAMGSVVPVFGTAAGAVIGGLAGLFGGEEESEAPKGPAGPMYVENRDGTLGSSQYIGQYGAPQVNWGGYENGANDYAQLGLGGFQKSMGGQDWATQQMQARRGPQASENQFLSDQESYSRGYHQNGALQLAQEAAMGQGPSEAAFMMQRGLDQSLAAQQSQMGSARGNAGIALASGNAAANSANLMSQTYGQAGQLRASEMANARGLYGQMSGQQREQDQSRLQMGNQMGQYNASLNDAYRTGMGGVANAYGQTGIGYYNGSMNPITQQGNLSIQGHQIGADSNNNAWDRFGNVKSDEADRRAGSKKDDKALVGTGITAVGQVAGAAV